MKEITKKQIEIMKEEKLLSLVLLLFISFNSYSQSSFYEGFEEGFCEGWKDVKGEFAVCPVTPVCPIPEVGKDNYKGGYNTGFKAGREQAKTIQLIIEQQHQIKTKNLML